MAAYRPHGDLHPKGSYERASCIKKVGDDEIKKRQCPTLLAGNAERSRNPRCPKRIDGHEEKEPRAELIGPRHGWEAARGYSRSLLAPWAGLPTSLAKRNCLGVLEPEMLLLLVLLSLRAGDCAGAG